MIKLRAHHLLCFLGFRGYGYNKGFVDNFMRVYQKVYINNQRVKIISSPDVICKNCPNKKTEGCLQEEKVKKKDQFLIEYLFGLNINGTISPKEAYQYLAKMSIEEFERLCSRCEWYSYGFCRQGFLNLKNGGDNKVGD